MSQAMGWMNLRFCVESPLLLLLWSDAQRLVNPCKVVVHVVECHSRRVILAKSSC